MNITAPTALRPYGQHADDLDVPFATRPADEATTALLAACLGSTRQLVAGWSLARRLQALLALHQAQSPGAELPALLRCRHCGTRFELEIEPAQCLRTVDETPWTWAAPDGRSLQLRLPSAADLSTWRTAGCAHAAAVASALVVSVDGIAPGDGFVLPSDWVEPVSAALAERDPLGALQADALCPDCDGVNTTDLDLEALLLAGFATQQRQLLAEVAALARAFHWSEAQILALPAWRRAFYLAHVDTDGHGPV